MDYVHNSVQLIQFLPKRLFLFDSLRKGIALQSGERDYIIYHNVVSH